MAEFIYQMIKARKSYGDRVILDDVTLSFLPRPPRSAWWARTAWASPRCSRSWPASRTSSNGEAYLTPGFTVGILQQEPPLDDTQDRRREPSKMAFGEIAEKVAPLQPDRRRRWRIRTRTSMR